MKSNLSKILFALFAVFNIIYSFWKNAETERMFFIEMNVWVYRLIWVVFLFGIAYEYFKKENPETK